MLHQLLIASAFNCFLTVKRDVKHFVLCADNCGAQNKNWSLYTALCAAVNSVDGPRSICIKYLEAGHTFMSADSFHRIVEQRMKKVGDVCDFHDFTEIINFRGIAALLKAIDIIMYPKGVSTPKTTSSKPKLKHERVVEFRYGSDEIFWKTEWNEENYRSSQFLMQKFSRDILKGNEYCLGRKQEPRGVTTSKKQDIINKLCPLMPENRRKFWNDLPCCDDSIDLANQRENGDYVYKD